MLNLIWSIMIIFSIVYTIFTSNSGALVNIINSSVQNAGQLFLTLAPLMCFWSGIMEITEKCGVTKVIAACLSPVTGFLFREIKDDDDAMQKISMNMSANILGMGNAATPLGLCAMERLDVLNSFSTKASDAMCMFVVINTASIQLIPSSVITMRAAFGSQSPSDILPAVWLTTAAAFTIGIICAKICSGRSSYE